MTAPEPHTQHPSTPPATRSRKPPASARCAERIPAGAAFVPCHRPLHTDDQRQAGLCGRHLAARRRYQARAAEWEARFTADTQTERHTQAIIGRVRGDHGITIRMDPAAPTNIVMDAVDLDRLLVHLTGTTPTPAPVTPPETASRDNGLGVHPTPTRD